MRMRQMKFRAWFSHHKKMVQSENLFLHYDGEDSFDFAFDKTVLNEEGHAEGTMNFEVLQYTGVKVNGDKELFEGDIVPIEVNVHLGWKQGWKKFKRNAVVKFIENEMGFMFSANTPYGNQLVPFDKGVRQSYKIIGNIYEHPELLEVAE